MNPRDAKPRGIADGDIIRLFNARGACLAAVRVTEAIAPGIVQLPTGAWYDLTDHEEEAPLCVHGNPNVLTRDVGTSSFAQGCTGQITTVQVERLNGNLPPIRAFDPVWGEGARLDGAVVRTRVLSTMHTRLRVQAAPGLPCALYFQWATTVQTSGAFASREGFCMFAPLACPASCRGIRHSRGVSVELRNCAQGGR
jgi:hypothetical protein